MVKIIFKVCFLFKAAFILIVYILVYILIYTFDIYKQLSSYINLGSRKIAPNPKTKPNLYPNPNLNQEAIFLRDNCPDTINLYIKKQHVFLLHNDDLYPFILFKSNRGWFEKYKSGISFVS